MSNNSDQPPLPARPSVQPAKPMGAEPTAEWPSGVAAPPEAAVPAADAGATPLAAAETIIPSPQITELPHLDAKSIVMDLLPEGGFSGIRLKDLESDIPAPTIRTGADKYQILKTVGQGGMGRVYLVYDHDLKRTLALKMIRGRSHERELRFLKEAQVMAQLEHPNIVPLHELGVSASHSPYYTMPLVRGQTLHDILNGLRTRDPKIVRGFSLTRLVQILQQIALALGYAHAKGVVHRDVKPANVMLGEHGEVRVLDWGLSKVIGEDDIVVDGDALLTVPGRVVGTPMYMAPEQSVGDAVDARADVYALGVMMYVSLTLTPPFSGSAVEVMTAQVHTQPESPRLRAPGREIPLELERVCLKAMSKDPAARHADGRAFHEELQTWLETEADKAQRHQRAEERAAEGRRQLEEWRALELEVRRLEREAGRLATSFRPWQSAEEKAPYYEAQVRAEQAKDRLGIEASDVISTLTEALGFERDNATARALLAEYYFERFSVAETAGDRREREFYGTLVTRYDDGRFTAELTGDGLLSITSSPEGTEVLLYDLVERFATLIESNERSLGRTPLHGVPLPMGNYLIILRREGYRDLRYPLSIGRSQVHSAEVRMYRDSEIGEGFVHVPAGAFVAGGDVYARGLTQPRAEIVLPDYFISVHPVTMAEYLEFLNDIGGSDPEQALRRSPRRAPEGESYLVQDGAGRLRFPDVDADGDQWYPRWPAFLVSWHDAVAYCAWRSAREGGHGFSYRLPSELEWEKAARGVDGRAYPWGNRYDASMCNLRESRRERPAPVAVDEYPGDRSIYGVRGMGGNISDWTATEILVGEGEQARDARVTRGGGWDTDPAEARVASRTWNGPLNVVHFTGFRLVRTQSFK